jgi:salicylate hydroxylase
MSPVQDLIEQTDHRDIWATPLYDRKPMTLRPTKAASSRHQMAATIPASHITVVGDACHPMSMFKGQGANQALLDGPLLTSWLSRGGEAYLLFLLSRHLGVGRKQPLAISQRIQNFEREMIARTSPKVQASFEASAFLHSPAVLDKGYEIEGADHRTSREILRQLEEQGITSTRGEELERLMVDIFCQLKEARGAVGDGSESN